MNVRNIILYMIAVCCMAAGVSSCVLSEKADPLVEDRTIWYNPAPVKTLPQTKEVEAFPTSSSFGSYAYMVPEGKTYDANKADADVVTFIGNEKITYQTDRWKGTSTYYWPLTGSLTFISYAPYELSQRTDFTFGCNKSVGISITGFSLPTTIGYTDSKDDILTTDFVKDLTGNAAYYASGVPTVFKHRLCKVAVKASVNNELGSGESVQINSVSLQNIYTKGNYSSVGGWTFQPTLENYSIGALDKTLSMTPDVVFAETLMIPQTTTLSDRGPGNDPKLVVNYTVNENTKTAELKLYSGPSTLSAWEEGKVVTYYISISTKDEYIEFSGSLDDWEKAQDGDINMGLDMSL